MFKKADGAECISGTELSCYEKNITSDIYFIIEKEALFSYRMYDSCFQNRKRQHCCSDNILPLQWGKCKYPFRYMPYTLNYLCFFWYEAYYSLDILLQSTFLIP